MIRCKKFRLWIDPDYGTRECLTCGVAAVGYGDAVRHEGEEDPTLEDEAPLDRARADVGREHPPESHAAAAKALRTSTSLRAQVLALVAARGENGATSDEVEQHTGRAHQSISATLYGLEKDGLATRTGPLRRTRYANDARAYVVTGFGLSELRRLIVPRPRW